MVEMTDRGEARTGKESFWWCGPVPEFCVPYRRGASVEAAKRRIIKSKPVNRTFVAPLTDPATYGEIRWSGFNHT